MTTTERMADRLLIGSARHARWWLPVFAVAELATACAQLVLPLTLGRAVDEALTSGPGGWVIGCAAALAALALGGALADYATGAAHARSGAWLRHRFVEHTCAVGPRAQRQFGTGDLVSRLVGSTAEAGNGPVAAISSVIALLPTVGSVIALACIDIWLGVTFALGLPVLSGLLRVFVRDTSAIVTRYQRVQGRIAGLLTEAVGGLRTIAAAGTTEREAHRVLDPLGELRRHGHEMWRVQARAATSGALLVPLLEIAVLAVAGAELTAGRISVGDLLAAARYAALGAGIGAVVSTFGQLARARGGARRAHEVFALAPPDSGTYQPVDAVQGELTFHDVHLSDVLRGVALTVPAGTSLALVGRSGSGKSLIAALAGRLAEPDSGTVTVDGIPLGDWDRAALRRTVGYAFERPALLGDTVADCISMEDTEAEKRRVEAAARAASVHDAISRLPAGYDTALSAAPMSGGEAQRLGLARALAQPGRVLILDDATSSVDTVTELRISRAITDQAGDRTRLLITHRLGTAARADAVAWLDDGVIRAVGPHEKLWSQPDYRAVFAADAVAG